MTTEICPFQLEVKGVVLIDSMLPEEWPKLQDRIIGVDVSVNGAPSDKTKQVAG